MPQANYKKLSLLLVITVMIGLLAFSAGAQGIPDVPREDTVIFDIDGGTATIANPFNYSFLAPGGISGPRNAGYHQAVNEPLFILNYETGEIQPWLGESFTPNETLDVWTLKIRDGVKWSDGEAYNADDVVFSVNLRLEDETASLADAAALQQWIESVEKVDDLTVQFNLKMPNPRFQLDYFSVRIWGSFLVLPEHVWAGQDPFSFEFYDLEKGWPMGTGPYKMVSASENEFIYDLREDWWGAETGWKPLPQPKRLIWVATGNDDVRSLLTIDNQLDSVMDITLGAFEAIIAQNPNVVAWQSQLPYAWLDPCPRQMSINHTIAPWDDPEMRWALNYAMDRNQIVEIAYEGTTIPSRSMFVEYGGLINPYINALESAGLTMGFTADVARAQEIIESKGYTLNGNGIYELNGEELSLNIQAHEGFIEKRRIAENVVEQYRSAGIAATQSNVEGATWGDNKAFGNFEAVLDWDSCNSINEPWASMDRYSNDWLVPVGERAPGTNNFVRWSGEKNDRYSELVDQIGVLPLGDEAIMPLFMEAMQLWYEELPFIPITQAKKLIPFNTTYWTGWPTAENNFNHPATWWQSTHQILHELQKAQ